MGGKRRGQPTEGQLFICKGNYAPWLPWAPPGRWCVDATKRENQKKKKKKKKKTTTK